MRTNLVAMQLGSGAARNGEKERRDNEEGNKALHCEGADITTFVKGD